MKKQKPHISESVARYGFQWGPIAVTRAFSDKKYGYCVMIQTEHKKISVYVSPKGHSIRVVK